MPRSDYKFILPMRVRYAECDVQGVVFNSRYLEYLDVGITEYWRTIGIFGLEGELEFHVVRNTVDYRKPLLLDEEFDVCLRLSGVGRTSMTSHWEIHGREAEDLRASGETINVHVAEVRGAPAAVPTRVIELFEIYEGRSLRREKTAL